MMEWASNFDLASWVEHIGYVGVGIVVFLEMGVFFGFFLPGDSLVLTCGILAAKGFFHIAILVPLLVVTAILGYSFGYWFGNKLGHWLNRQEDRWWFKRKNLEKTHAFYQKHGGKALIFGRLIPVVRTFVPIVAGMAKMDGRRFFLFNIIGALVWGAGITLLGYYMGTLIPGISKIFLPIVLIIILISILPGIIHFWKERKNRKKV